MSDGAAGSERDREAPIGWWKVLRVPSGELARAHDWLRGSAAGLITLAVLTGAGAGAGAVVFRELIVGFTELFTGRSDYSGSGHAASPHFPGLGIFFVVLVPVLGGLVYGPLVDRFAREARGHGVPEVMLAIAEKGGRIPPAVAVVKSLASALCIGSGGSVGREGPIVQIGSALGSTLGQTLRVPESRLRLLVACGAAGGISATFNAPIAGVFFALELILRDFETESFGAVVLASVTAAVIGRAAFGDYPFLSLPSFHVSSPVEFGFYALLGLVAAVGGVWFTRVLYGLEDVFDRLWRAPEWLRPAGGGILLGLLLLGLPEMYGVGYPVLQNGVAGGYSAIFLLTLFAGKMLATSLTIAIGGSGGVFAPSLFMGAMLGTAFGDGVHLALPHLTAPAGAYGLVGMGALFAGATRAPITGVIIIFELTGDYSIVLPLMTAIVLATAMSNRLSKDTIYTLKLRRRGIDIMRGRSANLMEILTVADAMQPVPPTLSQSDPLHVVIDRFTHLDREALPVVDPAGRYRGSVTAKEVEQGARDNTLDATAGELARTLPPLSTALTLHAAVAALASHDASGLPVLSLDQQQIVGWLNHRDILRAYSARVRAGAAQAGSAPTRDTPARPVSPTWRRSLPPPLPGSPPSSDDLGAFRVVDLELTDGEPPAGQTVLEVNWPGRSHLLALRRDGQTIPVTAHTVLSAGDRLTLLIDAEHAATVADDLRSTDSS